jgi:Leucine-rich repeat (LRR) protein
MNSNITPLIYLLTINKLTKIFKVDNYYWKLLCILDFNNCYLNIILKNFYQKYKFFKFYEKLDESHILFLYFFK